MSGASSCFGWANPGPAARGQPSSKREPPPNLQRRGERDVLRPLPGMLVNNEERRRGEQTRLGAQQPPIGSPVEGTRALIQLFGVAPHVPAVRPQRARVLRRPADIEQRAPLATRLAVLALGEDDQGSDACCSEPFPVVHDGTLERCTLVIGRQSSVLSTDD